MMKSAQKPVGMILCLCLCLSACGQGIPFVGDDEADAVVVNPVLEQAVSSSDRPLQDSERDEKRMPLAVMSFFEIDAGQSVLDVLAAGGYYTELLSRAVGPEGTVYSHNNAAYRKFLGDQDVPRYANGRLPNVIQLEQELEAIDVSSDSLDAVFLVLSYHDIYFKPPDATTWPSVDGPQLLANIYRMLKPGGVLGVIDHRGRSGIGLEEINQLHRIDEGRAIREIKAMGFKLEDSADFLENSEDDYARSVFDASVRGSTDRFVLKFRKPAE